jgi:hypothetical protein
MSDTDKVIEFEVYSPTLESFLGAVKAVNQEQADQIARALEAKSGLGWYTREVVLNERPIPMWSFIPTAITVDEARSLAARHGQDRMVIIAWNAQNKMVNVVTAGSNAEHSNASLALSEFIMRAMGFNPGADKQPLEDRRHEHDSRLRPVLTGEWQEGQRLCAALPMAISDPKALNGRQVKVGDELYIIQGVDLPMHAPPWSVGEKAVFDLRPLEGRPCA